MFVAHNSNSTQPHQYWPLRHTHHDGKLEGGEAATRTQRIADEEARRWRQTRGGGSSLMGKVRERWHSWWNINDRHGLHFLCKRNSGGQSLQVREEFCRAPFFHDSGNRRILDSSHNSLFIDSWPKDSDTMTSFAANSYFFSLSMSPGTKNVTTADESLIVIKDPFAGVKYISKKTATWEKLLSCQIFENSAGWARISFVNKRYENFPWTTQMR